MISLSSSATAAAFAALASSGLQDERPVQDLVCLALNVYHEARGEDLAGQAAVAHVTLNRAEDPAFPGSVCGVVAQCAGAACQFGWWRRVAPEPRNPQAWGRALDVAAAALTGRSPDPTRGAHYFVDASRPIPAWARRFEPTATIGGHRFLRR